MSGWLKASAAVSFTQEQVLGIAMDTIKAVIGNLFGSVIGITFMLVGTLGCSP
jgi:hypothetical protein